MASSPYFWTDAVQASERLRGTVVLYDDIPAYITDIFEEGGEVKAYMKTADNPKENVRKNLSSPKFKRFRELPRLGWMNQSPSQGPAIFLNRSTYRGRLHGLNSNNVALFSFYGGRVTQNRDLNFLNICLRKELVDTHKGIYPRLSEILLRIAEEQVIAYSNKYAVYCDSDGLKWLYRDCSRVGLFTGADTLSLLKPSRCYREEIMEDRSFTLNTIMEF